MGKDILFKTDDFVFSYRVGGILIHNNKILLQKPKNDDGYSVIGGHISAMETAEETLKREFAEELHALIGIEAMIAVGEIFFPWGKRPCHQIGFYYSVSLKNVAEIPMRGIFHGYDVLDNKKFDLDFCWIDIEELKNGLKVYPQELVPIILENSGEIRHFISKQI